MDTLGKLQQAQRIEPIQLANLAPSMLTTSGAKWALFESGLLWASSVYP